MYACIVNFDGCKKRVYAHASLPVLSTVKKRVSNTVWSFSAYCLCMCCVSIHRYDNVGVDNIGTVERIFVKSACDKMHFQSKLRVCKKVTLRTNPYYTFNCAESRCIYFGAVLKNRRNFTLPMKMKTRLLLTVEALQCSTSQPNKASQLLTTIIKQS